VRNLNSWIWYVLAVVCMIVAFELGHAFTWQYFISAFLLMIAGALIWEHVDIRSRVPLHRKPECKPPARLYCVTPEQKELIQYAAMIGKTYKPQEEDTCVN
jgi:hypothetical protein